MADCFECGKTASVKHHVVPRSRGGVRTVDLCGRCHGKAHHRKKNMTTAALTRAALAKKKAAGKRVGNIPYGWNVDADNNLISVVEEQVIIAKMKEWRTAGVSFRRIAGMLTDAGIATKKGNATWYPMTVRSVLFKNAGRLRYGR